MMNKIKLDERQLLIRGDIFKHGLMVMSGLLILDAFLTDFGIFKIEGMWSNFMILIIPGAVCAIEKICRDAFDIRNKRMTFLISAIGVLGLLSLILGIMDLVTQGQSMMVNSTLTENGAYMLYSIIMIVIFCIFIVKRISSGSQKEKDPYQND